MSDAKSFEDRIGDAIVARFFDPMITGIDSTNGSLFSTPSPVAVLAGEIYRSQKASIDREVMERVSIEDIADALTGKVVADLVQRLDPSGRRYGYSAFDKDREAMRRMVNERVADELARRALAKMDADAGVNTEAA